MFGLFRPKLSLDQAKAMLVDRISAYDASASTERTQFRSRIPDYIRLEDEFQFIALFTVYFHLKFTRDRSWRRHGRELFERVLLGVHHSLYPENPNPSVLGLERIDIRMKMYGLAIEVSAGNPRPDIVAREVGTSFATLCSAENDEQLIAEGAAIFDSESTAMLALFERFGLAG